MAYEWDYRCGNCGVIGKIVENDTSGPVRLDVPPYRCTDCDSDLLIPLGPTPIEAAFDPRYPLGRKLVENLKARQSDVWPDGSESTNRATVVTDDE